MPRPCIAWTYPWLARYWSALRTVLREIPNSSAREFSEGRNDKKGYVPRSIPVRSAE